MPRPQASALKADGVAIFTIGVGPNVLMSELLAIASKPEFVFNVTDFTQLTTINETIVDSACKVASKYLNVREFRRDNEKWTIQRNWQHNVHKTEKNTTQYVLDIY